MAVEGKLPLKLPPAFPLVAAAGPGISCLALRGAVSPAGLAQPSSTRLSSIPPPHFMHLVSTHLLWSGQEDRFPCPQELEA